MMEFMTQSLHEIISKKANDLLGSLDRVSMLEAGCGSATHFHINKVARSVGVDISQAQLDKNKMIQEKILGDIQTHPLPPDTFDLIICWNVIEHLSHPQQALRNFSATLKPGGLLVLGFPNLISFKGLVTKFTPFWFHEFFYKFMRYQFRPFKTYLRREIIPSKLLPFTQQIGFDPIFVDIFEGGVQLKVRKRFPPIAWGFAVTNGLVRCLSLGRAPSLYLDNCAFIFQKRQGAKTENSSCSARLTSTV